MRVLSIVASTMFLGCSAVLSAQTQDDLWKQCEGNDDAAAIASCTVLIQSGQLSGANLANAFYDRGVSYVDKGAYDQAIQDFNQAIKLNPSRVDAFNNLGFAYTYTGAYDQAIQDYSQAIALRPTSVESLAGRCYDRAIVGQLQPALADCNQALSSSPNGANALENSAYALDKRCFVYLKMNNSDAAIADCNAALVIYPKMASSLYSRGLAERMKGNTAASNTDIAAAKAIQADIADQFAKLGVPAPTP